jgi:Tol biopolymer transport system component
VRAHLILLLGLWTLVGCGAERTSSAVPTDTPDAIATEVASLRATADAATARAPTASLAATDTSTPASTSTPTDSPAVAPGPTPQFTIAATLTPAPTATSADVATAAPRIAFYSDRDGEHGIYVMDADGGRVTRVVGGIAARLACSPDGKRISFAASFDTDQTDIYTIHVDGTGLRNLTKDAAWNWTSSWSPDGMRIAYNSDREASIDLYLMNHDGSGVRRLSKLPEDDGSPSWSPDGTQIAFDSAVFAPLVVDGKTSRSFTGSYVRVINVDGSGVTQLTEEPSGSDTVPTWSPDGKRIAYAHSARIFVMNADGSNKTQLTTGSDWWPKWSPDGAQILFEHMDPEGDIYVMDADGGGRANLTNHPAHDSTACWLR